MLLRVQMTITGTALPRIPERPQHTTGSTSIRMQLRQLRAQGTIAPMRMVFTDAPEWSASLSISTVEVSLHLPCRVARSHRNVRE